MYFDITDLKLCVNVANAGSITHGAKLTYLTLQSASERIRGLENELNVDIFVRSVKGVSLSNAGMYLLNMQKQFCSKLK
ncbi:helix-turn-helix domain-containing protein [Providencia rettgeri]|uniref:helix-turn-helix domain-containing protein n=1 Tax=Providencia rettgeri TaxID=587 RepID=UPI0034E67F28